MNRKFRLILAIALTLTIITGCNGNQAKDKEIKREDIKYTIVEIKDIPKELAEAIERKKESEFKLTFETDQDLYLVHGYGEQETGGYNIVVRDLFLTENALYFDTELLSPKNDEYNKSSYPYIVVKTKKYEQNIVFE